MNNDEYATQGIHSQRKEALFTFAVRVLNRHCERVTQHLFGMGKADLVLAKIGLSLDGIKLDGHAPLCIFNAYRSSCWPAEPKAAANVKLTVLHYSIRTEPAYVQEIERYIRSHNKPHPGGLIRLDMSSISF